MYINKVFWIVLLSTMFIRDLVEYLLLLINDIKPSFGEAYINKGERVRKSKLASLRRQSVRTIKKQKLNKIYRELRKARRNK